MTTSRISGLLLLSMVLTTALGGCGGEDPQQPCGGVVCGDNARCAESTGQCVCDKGFFGDPSEGCWPGQRCPRTPCGGNGSCDDSSGAPVCTCDSGYDGDRCEQCATGFGKATNGQCVADACESNPCQDHGGCSLDDQGKPLCQCDPGYEGERCGECAAGYVKTGDDCMESSCTATTCSGHGTCSTTSTGTVSCACDAGYAGASCASCTASHVKVGSTCVANACGANSCSNHGTCATTGPGAVSCACQTGYTGSTCADCASGFEKVGSTCIASACTAGSCSGNGSCSTIGPGTVSCACHTGYTGATCADCASGFKKVGSTCVAETCHAGSCSGHGTCSMPTPGTVSCACDTGYAGSTCGGCATNYIDEGSGCIHTKTVPCRDEAPVNATSQAADATVTYSTGSGWSQAAACAWTCDSGFRELDGACTPDYVIGWCGVDPKTFSADTSVATTLYGQLHVNGKTGGAQPLAGVVAKLCYSASPITAPVNLAQLNCRAATFNLGTNNNDRYAVSISWSVPGTYHYLYAFSVDEGGTYSACDQNGLVGATVTPGVATITKPPPKPKVLDAEAVSATEVTVTFDGPLDEASVLANGSQFTLPALSVTRAEVVGELARLTTSPQTSGTRYTVTVASTVKGTNGVGVDPAFNTRQFHGFGMHNPLINGDFEVWDSATKATAWNTSGLIVNQEATLKHGGNYSVKLTRTSPSNSTYQNDYLSSVVGVTSGTEYRVSLWVLDTVGGQATLGFNWFKTDGSAIGSTSFTGLYSKASPNWQRLTKVVTAPANAVSLGVTIRVDQSIGSTAIVVYLDDVTVTWP